DLGGGSRSGTSTIRPSGRTPAHRVTMNSPFASASSLIFSSLTPQPRGSEILSRRARRSSWCRSHCWKWCGVRNIPSLHATFWTWSTQPLPAPARGLFLLQFEPVFDQLEDLAAGLVAIHHDVALHPLLRLPLVHRHHADEPHFLRQLAQVER